MGREFLWGDENVLKLIMGKAVQLCKRSKKH